MNIIDFPSYVSVALGVTEFMAGLIITTFLLIIAIIAVNMNTESDAGNLYTALVSFSILAISASIGWIDQWFPLMTGMIIVALYKKILKF